MRAIAFFNPAAPGSIGAGTPSSGAFTTLTAAGVASLGKDSPNYVQVAGGSTSKAVQFLAVGADASISQVLQSKGAGAIDLAAGSSGVNISNGGTITAITRTVQGSLYTSVPSLVISAPTTAGGVQATATVNLGVLASTIVGGGTGYTAGDTLTIVGGTGTAAQLTVGTVSSGVISTVTVAAQNGVYSVFPTSPVSVTGGTGSGATFNISGGILSTFTITNAGSGYVEQPIVIFSGGGGSGAAAYASVGSGTVVKSLGPTMLFQTSGGTAFGVTDIANSVNYIRNQGAASGFQVFSTVQGADSNISYALTSKGNGAVSFYTNLGNQLQFTVAHTASAVNYVQVTGAATGGAPTISAAGSDVNVPLLFSTKGTSAFSVWTGGNKQFQVANTASATNYLQVSGGTASSSPVLASIGADTNIDLTLTPKGTGVIQFGSLTATVDAPITGYISIRDTGGTLRKLAVIA